MSENESIPSSSPPRPQPGNKGKLIGAKPPLQASHVWSIRTKLQLEKRTRDLALFNLAIDSKPCGCDVAAIRVDDVFANGYTLDRATVRQKQTRRPVRFELTEQTREAIAEYLRLNCRKPGDFLFAGRGDGCGLTTRQYARLVRPPNGEDVPFSELDDATESGRAQVRLPGRWLRTIRQPRPLGLAIRHVVEIFFIFRSREQNAFAFDASTILRR